MKKKLSLVSFTLFLLISSFAFASSSYEFTDSLGRKVMLPENITAVSPSGYNAQVILVGLAPEKIVALAKRPPKKVIEAIPSYPLDKPEIGQLYGKNPNFNKEELMKVNPQMIIDLGEKKKTILEDMDQVQKNTGIPTIFIEFTPETSAKAYEILGKLLKKEEVASKISAFLNKEVTTIQETLKKIPADKRVSFIQVGGKALMVDPAHSSHTEAIEFAGGINKAKPQNKDTKNKTENLNIEEIISWNPDVIFAKDAASYEIITHDPTWQTLSAVKAGKVYLIPETPYSWVDSPPSVNKMLGIYWAAQKLYPESFSYNMDKLSEEFHSLVFHMNSSGK